jgi:hypothetical protein
MGTWQKFGEEGKRMRETGKDQMLQKLECYAWEIARIRNESDERTSSPVSPGLIEFLVSWSLGLIC